VIPQFATRMMETPTAGKGEKPEPFPIQGSGNETRSFCHIDDCVDGLMALYERGENRNVYHLGNPAEEYTIRDLAQRVAHWFGKRVTVHPGELPKGSPTRRAPDIGKLQALGYRPKVSLADGLPETLEWYYRQTHPEAA
jgi:nucleoside-diphosphate-sugar epimerase